jgi:hypothetical protein
MWAADELFTQLVGEEQQFFCATMDLLVMSWVLVYTRRERRALPAKIFHAAMDFAQSNVS